MKTKYALASLTIATLAMIALAGCSEPAQKSEQKADTAKKQYTCEMHPEVVFDTPGECPKCHMKLTEKK
jgi:Cu+-exporting ATPase